jgi:hypothetical protein
VRRNAENARVAERKPPVVPRKQKIPDPLKKKPTIKKNLFFAFPESAARIFSIYRFSDFSHR